MIKQFEKIGSIDDKSSDLQSHYKLLLENCVSIRLFSLLLSLDGAEEMVEEALRVCLQTPTPQLPANVRNSFEELFFHLIEECEDVSTRMMELIFEPLKNPVRFRHQSLVGLTIPTESESVRV